MDLLDRMPGPHPVVFGSNERKDALVQRLTSGQLRASANTDLDSARKTLRRAIASVLSSGPASPHISSSSTSRDRILDRLDLIDRIAAADSSTVTNLLAAAAEPGGFFARRRRAKA